MKFTFLFTPTRKKLDGYNFLAFQAGNSDSKGKLVDEVVIFLRGVLENEEWEVKIVERLNFKKWGDGPRETALASYGL